MIYFSLLVDKSENLPWHYRAMLCFTWLKRTNRLTHSNRLWCCVINRVGWIKHSIALVHAHCMCVYACQCIIQYWLARQQYRDLIADFVMISR